MTGRTPIADSAIAAGQQIRQKAVRAGKAWEQGQIRAEASAIRAFPADPQWAANGIRAGAFAGY